MSTRAKKLLYLAIQEAGSEHMSYRKSQVAGGPRVRRVIRQEASSWLAATQCLASSNEKSGRRV